MEKKNTDGKKYIVLVYNDDSISLYASKLYNSYKRADGVRKILSDYVLDSCGGGEAIMLEVPSDGCYIACVCCSGFELAAICKSEEEADGRMEEVWKELATDCFNAVLQVSPDGCVSTIKQWF